MTDEEKAIIGYQSALQMIAYEGQLIWRCFAAIAMVNAFVLLLGVAGAKLFPNLAGQKLIPCLGIATCICWLLAVTRQYSSYAYWFAWARTLEAAHLGPVVQMMSSGATFARGQPVQVGDQEQQLSWLGRWFKVQWLAYCIIGLYIALYCLLFTL